MFIKTAKIISGITVLLLSAACAQSPVGQGNVKNYDTTVYEATTAESTTLYDQIGGREVISKIMTQAVEGFKADPRLADSFKDTPTERLAFFLTDQLCELAQGPCTYAGKNMQDAHRGMAINEVQFNALVEVLQVAIRDNGLPFTVENKILALFAPMKPAVIDQ